MTDQSDTTARKLKVPPWILPLMIGLVTIVAGIFTWRAGQLGSTAAFQDRQAVGQTITQQQQAIEVGLGAVSDAVAYVRYVADFAEAGALDDVSAELNQKQAPALAGTFSDDATRRRRSASELAAAEGVFGRQTIMAQIATSATAPLPFDIDTQIQTLQAQVTTGIASAGVLHPDRWAHRADDTRHRVRGLRLAAMLLLVAVVGFTIAQLSSRRLTRWTGLLAGSALFVVVVFVTVGRFW